MSRRSPPPNHHRTRSQSPVASRDGGYGARLGNGPDRGPSRRYDPRDDKGGRPGPSRARGGATGSYTSRDREGERKNERERYDDRSRREGDDDDDLPPPPKSPPKPNFNPSGLLAAETNTVLVPDKEGNSTAGTKGVILKYNEPPEARKPTKNWRLYVFKGKEQVDLVHLHRQSAYLVGRDQVVSDIPIAHPSASKQHAVIQFRQMTEKNEFGDSKTAIKPFLIDLDSTNGTFVNDQEIPTSRYYELRQSDVLKFAQSTREYVLLHEESA